MNNDIVKTEEIAVQKTAVTSTKTPINFGIQGVQLSSMEDAFRFANAVSMSGFAPRGMEKPEAILVAIQLGAELGLTPMSALRNIAVINGRPAIYGDAALSLVRSSGLLEIFREEEVGEPGKDTFGVKVTAKRKGFDESSETFTVGDAKLSKLWGKAGPWTEHPKRMLKFRARGFILRDLFGDVLQGLRTQEEARDIPAEVNVTPLSEKVTRNLSESV